MIRFCDMEVYAIYEDEINRTQLFSFFCQKDHNTDIVIVYNHFNEFQGIITYDHLLQNNDNVIIQKERLSIGDDIWSKAREMFAKDERIIYLPLFNDSKELLYFCYDDKYSYNGMIEIIMRQFEDAQDYLFIEDLYPQVQGVYIYDMNEWAYRLYNILIKRNFPVVVIGEKWEIIGGIKQAQIENYPEYARMNIYSEGTQLVHRKIDRNSKNRFQTIDSFNFFDSIVKLNRIFIQNAIKKEFEKSGKLFFLCCFPTFDELEEYTLSEYYRSVNNIDIHKEINWNNKIVYKAIMDVYGKNQKDLIEIAEKDISSTQNSVFIDNLSFKSYNFGDGENTLYLIGLCIMAGYGVSEDESLGYILWDYLEKLYGKKYRVVTISVPTYDFVHYRSILETIPIKENDIIIWSDISFKNRIKSLVIQDFWDINLADLYNRRPKDEDWFSNTPIHTNVKGNKAIANELIVKYITPLISTLDFNKEQKWLQKERNDITEFEKNELQKYLDTIKVKSFEARENFKIGSIVMNCNPLTLGHLYLIEQARKLVDYLYIFVVEEDRSFFPFEDRIELVKKGVCKWDNINVVPSGKFILSYETMPLYFEKSIKQEVVIDASKDIMIFAKYVAPDLGIQLRFAGEEPLDNVTNQYNLEMRRTLTMFGIEFVEIPRIEKASQVISASRVRKSLETGDFDEIKEIVPACTYEYLKKFYHKNNNIIV